MPLRINLISSCLSRTPRLKRSNQLLSNSLICSHRFRSHGFAASPRISREFCVERPPSEIRGRGATPRGEQGTPGADAPAAARGVVGSTRVSHHGHTGITRHSPRNGFNSLFRALPGDRACLPPSPRGYRRVRPVRADIASATLDASVGASGPHDFAVREVASPVKRAARVHRIPPYVRDVAQRPSEWGGTARDMQVIWRWGQEKFGKSEIDRLGRLAAGKACCDGYNSCLKSYRANAYNSRVSRLSCTA